MSCIVPSYNYASFIGRALDSAIAQDYPAELLEIVVVDDGSTDATAEVVSAYGERVRYVRKENGGLNSAVDRGIAEASGELIAILDADDTWPAGKVRQQVELLKARPEVGLVHGDMEVIDAQDALVHPSFFRMYGLTPVRGRILPTLVRRNVVSGGSAMFRASLRDHYHPIGEASAFPDWWIAVGIARVAEIEWLPEPANRYRMHGENMGFGVDDAARLARVQRERDIPFRRWLLADLNRAEVAPADLLDAWGILAGSVARSAEALGEPLEAIAPVSPEQRERAMAATETGMAALHAGDLTAAVSALVAALALNPFDGRAGAALDAVAPLAGAAAPPTPFADARPRVTIALAAEVAADPSLLAAYADDADDDSTLVVYAPGMAEDEALELVAGAVDAAGLDADGGPDLMLHVSAGGLGEAEAIAPHVHARLGRCVSAFEHLPRVDDAGARSTAGR